MRRYQGAIPLIVLAIFAAFEPHGAAAVETTAVMFRSTGECVTNHKLTVRDCISWSQRARMLYLTQSPRYLSRQECNLFHSVCIALPPDWVTLAGSARDLQIVVRFAPPLWAIRVDDPSGAAVVTVLIDRHMEPMKTVNSSELLPVGRFSSTPAMLRLKYERALRGDAELARAGRSRNPARDLDSALEGLGPDDVFPIPQRMRRQQRR